MATKTATTETHRDPVVTTVKAIAYGMFATGVALSVTHIFDFFHSTLGAATLTAAAMPMFVDGFQIVGRVLRLDRFAKSVNATGWKLQLLGALASLIANVVAGPTKGDKIAGIILVVGYITIEAVADRIKSRHAEEAEEAEAAAAAKKQAAIAQAKATRAANKATAAAAKAKEEADVAARAERRAKARAARTVVQTAEKIVTDADFRNANAYI